LRDPGHVADEVQALLDQGVDVLHLCDAEFNLPPTHAEQVCDELIRRRLGDRLRWYAYLAVVPFTQRLAERMKQAGCAGINFTTDSVHHEMLRNYGQPHRHDHLAKAVSICRDQQITVMLDLLLGGPGETPETVATTIHAVQRISPDCAGAALGVRIYPGTPLATRVMDEGPAETNPNLCRKYQGGIDWLQPTFYVSQHLGSRPAKLVRELIDGDRRFFPPQDDGEPSEAEAADDHNYNENQSLIQAIDAGARGAYWDILRRLRG
jgi:radical SAM superfamily enzyme YgiQ (UPF0313 family)